VLIPLVTVFLGGGILFLTASVLRFGVLSGVARPLELNGLVAVVRGFEGLLAAGLRMVYRMITFSLDLFSRTPGLYLSWRSIYWAFLGVLLVPLAIDVWMRRRIPAC
jgi:hypothetical protein